MNIDRKSSFEGMVDSAFKIFLSRAANDAERLEWNKYFEAGGRPEDLVAYLRDGIRVASPRDNAPPIQSDRVPTSPESDVVTSKSQASTGKAKIKFLLNDPNSAAYSSLANPKLMIEGKSIAILSTYPPNPPRHGGQHRLLNIGLAYQRAGFTVVHGGVMGGTGFEDVPNFLHYPGAEIIDAITGFNPRLNEWAVGKLFASAGPLQKRLFELLGSPPDLIHVEQPWLYGFAKVWAEKKAGRAAKIIYGSQNIEYALTYEIVSKLYGRRIAEDCQEKVKSAELEAIQGADLVIGVTQSDCEWMIGRSGLPGLLAPNGVGQRLLTKSGLAEANDISGGGKFALVCASAHPPNIDSIFEIFGDGLACFSPREKLVLAGSVGPAVRADPRFASNSGLQRFLITPGMVSEECLKALLDTAHAILLPVTSGEGSNLKTAEALVAAKHIVATPIAFRGFEKFADAEGVSIAESFPEFLHSTRRAMELPPLAVSSSSAVSRHSLDWSNVLKSLVDSIQVSPMMGPST